MRPYPEMNSILNDAVAYGYRRVFTSANVWHLRGETFREAYDSLLRLTDPTIEGNLPSAAGTAIIVSPIPSKFLESKKAEDTAFAFRKPLVDVTIGPQWTNKEDDARMLEWAREIQRMIIKDGDPNRMCMYFNG